MNIQLFTFNPFQENTYIIYDKTKECIIIDPGCYEKHEEKQLEEFIRKKDLIPISLINTHCHIDHILGNQFVKETWNIELSMNILDIPLLENAEKIAQLYGLTKYKRSPLPTEFLEEGNVVKFGNSNLTVLFTPGHSPGHISLYNKEEKILVSGDVIFKGSVGRTDLPGGDHNILIKNIKNKILKLPDEIKIFSGHGPITNIGTERKENPFIQ